MPTEPTLLDYLKIISRRSRLLFACILLAALAAGGITFLLPKVYRAEASIFIRERPSFVGSVLSEIAMSLPLRLRSSSAQYVMAVLNSRSLAEAVAGQVKWPVARDVAAANALQPVSTTEHAELLREMLSISDQDGLVTIGVESGNPEFAAEVANAYIERLDGFLQKADSRRRVFTGAQLAKTRRDLEEAEEALKRFQEREVTFAPDVETEALVNALVALEGEERRTAASLAETTQMIQEVGSLQDVAMLETQRAGLAVRLAQVRQQLRSMEGRMARVPEKALQFARLKRDVELQLKKYLLLAEQHELALIAEQEEEVLFQTIDRAVVPIIPARPRLSFNIAIGVFMGLLIGAVGAFWLESPSRRSIGATTLRPTEA